MGKRNKKEKELRKMNRSELVDVIYELRKQNESLQSALDDRTIRMENAGSIAQVAMEVNNVFVAAQQAADDYIASVMKAFEEEDGGALQNQVNEILSSAKRRGDEEAAKIVEQAKMQAAKDVEPMRADIIKQAEEEASKAHAQAEKEVAEAKEQAEKLLADTKKEVDDMREEFLAEVTEIMKNHPEIKRHRKTAKKESV